MSAARSVLVLVLAVLGAGCAEAEGDDAASEEHLNALSVAGDGALAPPAPPGALGAPLPLPLPGSDLPVPRPESGDLRDPLGPEGACALGYLPIYDPVRARPVDVPIIVCQ